MLWEWEGNLARYHFSMNALDFLHNGLPNALAESSRRSLDNFGNVTCNSSCRCRSVSAPLHPHLLRSPRTDLLSTLYSIQSKSHFSLNMQAVLETRNLLNDASVCHPSDFLSLFSFYSTENACSLRGAKPDCVAPGT
jgi:hypothetical protein